MATATIKVWAATCHPGPSSTTVSSPPTPWSSSLPEVWFVPGTPSVSLVYCLLLSVSLIRVVAVEGLLTNWGKAVVWWGTGIDGEGCAVAVEKTDGVSRLLWPTVVAVVGKGEVKLGADVVGAVVCAWFTKDGGVFSVKDGAVVKTVLGWEVLCGAVVVCTALPGVEGWTEGAEVRGPTAGGGGWMNCRLSEGNGSEPLTRL